MSGGKNNKAKSVVLTFQNVLLRDAFLLKSHSLACRSCPDQFKHWEEEDGLAVLFGEGREKAAPWGLFDLSVLEESVCFCRQTVGKQAFISCVLMKLQAGCSCSLQGGSRQVWRD